MARADQAIKPGRLLRRADFLRVAAARRKSVAPGLILQAAQRPAQTDPTEGPQEPARVGFTATRKIGGAVQRNRAKRRLRAAARQVLPELAQPGTDYVLIARAETARRSWAELVADLERALRQMRHGRGPARQ